MKKLLLVMSALSFLSASPALALNAMSNQVPVEPRPEVTIWGGHGIEVRVDREDKTATVRFDCAEGRVLNFTAVEQNLAVGVGTYTREGGAIPPGGFHSVPASYVANHNSEEMALTVILQDSIQQFKLTKGVRGIVHYCP